MVARTHDLPQACDLRVAADLVFPQELIEPDREGHQPAHSPDAARRHLRGPAAADLLLPASAKMHPSRIVIPLMPLPPERNPLRNDSRESREEKRPGSQYDK
jgi:hypothetical protein